MIEPKQTKRAFQAAFGKGKTRDFFSPGRIEVVGNHTDHNHGLAVGACIDRGITASVKKNDDGCIQIASVGYKPFTFYVDELKYKASEKGTALALTKGVLFGLKERGYRIGGFQAALMSDIQSGSGLSSSACFECLIAKIIDVLYNDGDIDPKIIAEIGQYAENVYFGKPCGLLDQTAIACGGVNLLDFGAEDGIGVTPLQYHLPLKNVLINTGSSHEGLDALYARIPQDMRLVAENILGVTYLGQASEEEWMRAVSTGNLAVSESAKLTAQHFFDENKRCHTVVKALKENDSLTFLQALRESQLSMTTFLHNTMVPGQYTRSPQQAIDLATPFVGQGVVRMMGGGFAGSVLAYVYPADLAKFKEAMASYYGEKNVYEISFWPKGPSEIAA